jgi:hypothetical protein
VNTMKSHADASRAAPSSTGHDAPSRARPDSLQRSPRQVAQRATIASSFGPAAQLHAEPEPNRTGLPDGLKTGIESLSGLDMSGVRVHRNSDQPAKLNALAYAQGTDIHVAPGQEQHLPHEAWHVVQQAQGRVMPTRQMRDAVPVNDDTGLEHEADVMGARALTAQHVGKPGLPVQAVGALPPHGAASAALQMKGGLATQNCSAKSYVLNKGDRIAYDEVGGGFTMAITIRSRNGIALVPALLVKGGDAVNLKKVLEDIDEPALIDNTPTEKVAKISDEDRVLASRLAGAEKNSVNPDKEGGIDNSLFSKPKALRFDPSTGDIEVEMTLYTYNHWDRVAWKCQVGTRGLGVLLPEDRSWWSNPAWNAGQMYHGYQFRPGCDVSILGAQGRGEGGVRRVIRTTVPGHYVKQVFGQKLERLKKSSIICFGMEVVYGGSGPTTATKQEFAHVYDANVQTAHQYGLNATSTPESYGYVDLSEIKIAEGDWLSDEEVWALDIGPNPSPNIKLPLPLKYANAHLIEALAPKGGMQMATRIENEATLKVSSLPSLKNIIAQLNVLAKAPDLVGEIMQGDPTLSQFEWSIHSDDNSDVFTDVYLDDLKHTALRAGIGIRKRWTDKATKLNVKTGPGYQVGTLGKHDQESATVKSDIYRRHEIGYDLDPKASIPDIANFLAVGLTQNDPWNLGGHEVNQALPKGEVLDFKALRGTMVLKGNRRKFNLKAVHKVSRGAINIEISCDHTVGRTFEDYERMQQVADLFDGTANYAQVFNVEMELEHLGAGAKPTAQEPSGLPGTGSPQDQPVQGSKPLPETVLQDQPRRPREDHPGRIYLRHDTAHPNFNTPSFQVFAKAHQYMIQHLQQHLGDSTELSEDRQKLESLFTQLFPKQPQVYGPAVERGARRSPSSLGLPSPQTPVSWRSAGERVQQAQPGHHLVNVDGAGLNCSIRALMLASGHAIDEQDVTRLRNQLVDAAKAKEGSFLGLGLVEKESRHVFGLMFKYLQGRPVVVLYDHQAELDPQQVWPGTGKPVVVYLSGYHYQAVVPD